VLTGVDVVFEKGLKRHEVLEEEGDALPFLLAHERVEMNARGLVGKGVEDDEEVPLALEVEGDGRVARQVLPSLEQGRAQGKPHKRLRALLLAGRFFVLFPQEIGGVQGLVLVRIEIPGLYAYLDRGRAPFAFVVDGKPLALAQGEKVAVLKVVNQHEVLGQVRLLLLFLFVRSDCAHGEECEDTRHRAD